jgi:predicted DsbA family dithiol-disulfide isomerase
MPFELRPEPNPTLEPEGDYLQTAWKRSVLPTAERMGVNMVLPEISPQPHTHLAFEGYQYAKEHGKGNEYNHRMFTAFFQEEKNIGDIDVLTRLAGELGLKEDEFKEALVARKYKDVHQQALAHAYQEAQISAVPTFIIGDRVLQGLYDKESLEQVIEEEAEKFGDSLRDGLSL